MSGPRERARERVRILSLPAPEAFAHGTRARYVTGCRCDECRQANTDVVNARNRAVREAAAGAKPNCGPAQFMVFHRTRRDGTTYEVRGRACPGTSGRPCVAHGAWLRAGLAVCLKCVDRAFVWNGLVPAVRARRHLRKLSRAGVGYKAVSDACDVATGTLTDVIRGAVDRIRADTERRILAVDTGARADHALIPSAPTWELVDDLLERGFTLRWMSAELGYVWYAAIFAHTRGGRRALITAKNALAIERLHRRVLEENTAPPAAFVDAAETYRILGELLERVQRKPLSNLIGYNICATPPARVRAATAERIRAFAAELERRRIEGEPLPDGSQWGGNQSPIAAAFGYDGGWQRGRVEGRRARANARAREERELLDLLAGRGRRA